MIAVLDLNAMAQISTARIADCLVEGTLIAILAGGLLRVARGLTSETRFAVWFSAMMAVASLALLGSVERSHGGANSAAALHAALVVPGSWALYMFGAWAIFAAFFLARVGVAVLHVHRVRKSCVPLDPAFVDSKLREALELHGKSRRVVLCTSGWVNVPTAIGFLRPAVVLPAWLLEELSPAELRQLVLHELAHLRRWDDWTNLAQQLVKAVLFFHPAVWWMEKRASLEREMACDDAVVAETANPRAYAECLVHLAEKSMVRRGLALAQAALGRIRQTSLRVARILRRERPSTTKRGWIAAAAVVVGLAVACAVAVPRAPHLIAFEQDQPPMVAARLSPPPQMSLAAQDAAGAKLPVIGPSAAKFVNSKPRVVEAAAPRRRAASRRNGIEIARRETAPGPQSNLVQPARWAGASAASEPVTQAVYVVVESRVYLPSGVVLWRSSVWRITMAQPADNPGTRIPRKQT